MITETMRIALCFVPLGANKIFAGAPADRPCNNQCIILTKLTALISIFVSVQVEN